MLNLTIFDEGTGRVINITVDNSSATIAQVKQLIHAQTNHPIQRQSLSFEGNVLNDSDTLSSRNIKDHDVLLYNVTQQQTQPQPQQQQQQSFSSGGAMGAFGGWGGLGGPMQQQQQPRQQQASNPLQTLDLNATPTPQIIQALRNNAAVMQTIMTHNPQFAQAIMDNNVELVEQYLQPLKEKQRQAQLMMRLEQNPFDMEAQKMLEEIIQRQNIEENMANALEHNPESFASVYMLYVNSSVNGIPLKAFVDSGAQMTIMSKECAQKCNLLRLMDTRFSGMAKGVGTAKILGRIHLTQMKIGNSWFNLTITVLDQEGMEFLIGLDMLRRWQACIDLKNNVLVVGDERVPFLGESELPGRERIEQDLAIGSSPLPTTADRLPFHSSPSSTAATPSSTGATTTTTTTSSPAPSAVRSGSPAPTTTTTTGGFSPSRPTSQTTGGSAMTDTQRQQLDILNQFLRGTQQAPQQQQQQQQRPPQQQPAVQFSEDSIKQLMEMGGFDRETVVRALTRSGGNVDLAANILFGG